MNDGIVTPIENYINRFFWEAPNPMAITKASDGKYMEVNKIFEKCMGIPRQDMIGQTSVGIGYITADQRALLIHEIKEKGYAQNVEMDVKVKGNETRCGLFNSSLIKVGNEDLLLTAVTDISERKKAAEARQDDILFKSLAAIEGIGVIFVRGQYKKKTDSFFINMEARKALSRRPLKHFLDAIDGQESTYFSSRTGCYHVKTIPIKHGLPGKIIILERMPDSVCIQEKLKQYDLTSRQEEIALLAAMGHSNKEIAGKLFITEYTVKDHLKEIFHRVGVCKRSELCTTILKWR